MPVTSEMGSVEWSGWKDFLDYSSDEDKAEVSSAQPPAKRQKRDSAHTQPTMTSIIKLPAELLGHVIGSANFSATELASVRLSGKIFSKNSAVTAKLYDRLIDSMDDMPPTLQGVPGELNATTGMHQMLRLIIGANTRLDHADQLPLLCKLLEKRLDPVNAPLRRALLQAIVRHTQVDKRIHNLDAAQRERFVGVLLPRISLMPKDERGTALAFLHDITTKLPLARRAQLYRDLARYSAKCELSSDETITLYKKLIPSIQQLDESQQATTLASCLVESNPAEVTAQLNEAFALLPKELQGLRVSALITNRLRQPQDLNEELDSLLDAIGSLPRDLRAGPLATMCHKIPEPETDLSSDDEAEADDEINEGISKPMHDRMLAMILNLPDAQQGEVITAYAGNVHARQPICRAEDLAGLSAVHALIVGLPLRQQAAALAGLNRSLRDSNYRELDDEANRFIGLGLFHTIETYAAQYRSRCESLDEPHHDYQQIVLSLVEHIVHIDQIDESLLEPVETQEVFPRLEAEIARLDRNIQHVAVLPLLDLLHNLPTVEKRVVIHRMLKEIDAWQDLPASMRGKLLAAVANGASKGCWDGGHVPTDLTADDIRQIMGELERRYGLLTNDLDRAPLLHALQKLILSLPLVDQSNMTTRLMGYLDNVHRSQRRPIALEFMTARLGRLVSSAELVAVAKLITTLPREHQSQLLTKLLTLYIKRVPTNDDECFVAYLHNLCYALPPEQKRQIEQEISPDYKTFFHSISNEQVA